MIRTLLTFLYGEAVAHDFAYDDAMKSVELPGLPGVTVRRMMQTIGTDWGRVTIGSDLWVQALFNGITDRPIVIDDVRFPNEYDAIVKAGGLMWRIERPSADGSDTKYEGLLEDRKFAVTIQNTHEVKDLLDTVDLILSALRQFGVQQL